MRMTEGKGIGVLSPQAIGIATAAVVMIGFRALAPATPKLTSSVEEPVS
jgi:SSS family solute:Na+ symporter